MRKGPLLLATASAAALVATAAFLSWRRSTLLDLSFQTGWLLCAGVGLLAASWWFPRFDRGALARRVRKHLAVSAVLTLVYAAHVDLRLPVGWMESVLFVLFGLLLTSTVAGALLLRRGVASSDAPGIDRWLGLHVSITWALFGAAVFHGVFTHGHGLLAHVFVHG